MHHCMENACSGNKVYKRHEVLRVLLTGKMSKRKNEVFFPLRRPPGESRPGYLPARLFFIMALMSQVSWPDRLSL